jgi:hypothetical protein
MKKFWLLYLLLFISGSMAIYLKAPLVSDAVMPYVPTFLKPQDTSLGGTTTYVTNVVKGTIVPRDIPAHKRPPTQTGGSEVDSFVSPALEGIYFARSTEHPTWGVTHQKTSVYNEKGSYRGLLEGGTIFTCGKGKLTSSKGDLLECTPISGATTNGIMLLARKDAHFFTGDYTKLAKKQIEMLSTYYQLNTKLVDRRKKLVEEAANRNPYFQTSRAAYLAYNKSIEEAKALQQKAATATDTAKTLMDEQLRTLKMKEVPLKATFEAEQKKFVEWKTLHAHELPNPDTDVQIKNWKDEKAKLISELPGLAF